MKPEIDSKMIADDLIHWIREYGSLHIDSNLADIQRCFPPHVLLDLGNKGFFGMHISRKYGGLDLKTSDMLRVIEQISAIDLTLAIIIIEGIQGAHTLEKYATKKMKSKYLKLLAAGRIFTAGAMTESAAGSNPRGMKSVAIADKKRSWIINGSKRWVGMGASANLIAVYVHQFDSKNHWQGMSGFLVPHTTAGLRIGPDSLTMGMRGFSKNTIYMDNIYVSSENLLGKQGQGMEIAQDNMMYIRLCLAAASLGSMKRCVQLMARYAERRTIATGLLMDNPVTLVHLSEMTAVIDAIGNFVSIVSTFFDENESQVPEEFFVISKILGSEYLGWITDTLVQTLGARGYEESSGVAKIYRDARAFRIFEGPSEALNMYIGSRVLTKNLSLEYFVTNTLKQKKLFEEIKKDIERVNQYSLSKNKLFSKQFSVNYWSQVLSGNIISYGLLLIGLEYSLLKSNSENLQRASRWARDKYNSAVRDAMTFSCGEKVLIKSSQIKDLISIYGKHIGNIDQMRQTQETEIDDLLKINPTLNNQESNPYIEHDLFLKELSGVETDADYALIANKDGNLQMSDAFNCIESDTKYLNVCLHQIFEDQAKKNPNSIAVVFQDKKISYEELDVQSNKVAAYLRSEGVTGDTLVAIYIERSIEMIIGLLAIFKAGGAYLPLDINYPEKSLKFIFEDSHAKLVLTQRKLSNTIPFKAEKVIFLDEVINDAPPIVKGKHKSQIDSNNLGYVIYTSGSTGRPKGVMLPHKALTNLLHWHNKKIQGKRNVLQFTTLNFDMSIIEIFSALNSGGSLVLISEQDRLDVLKFSEIVKEHNVEQIITSVVFLKKLAESKPEKKYFSHIKEIIVAGEQLIITPDLLFFFNQLKCCKLFNYYGPSETHVVTAYEFPKNISNWPTYAPIGRPIPNTKLLILDDKQHIVPFKTPGEIYIGGVCLAKGYMNNPELTEKKFIKDPWGKNHADKLYKTGDYGQYLSNGEIVFMGRIDQQVKIRGFRIEPQEIEWHLMHFPGIKEAVVIAKKNEHMEKHLEAFIVLSEDVADDFINDIYSFLQERLPPHMLPSLFNIIEEIPLTESGKVNRIELEKRQLAVTHSVHNLMEPKNNIEKKLITIMEDIFKLKIGINNSFISIGGNSLLAMHIVSVIREKFSLELPAHSILSDPSIGHTAKRIELLIQYECSSLGRISLN